jgi:hypothetical protein
MQASRCGNTTAVIQAIARWGADMELEACCKQLDELQLGTCYPVTGDKLRAARRPKPPTLKEQALYALDEAESSGCLHLNGLGDTIRRALEALPDA